MKVGDEVRLKRDGFHVKMHTKLHVSEMTALLKGPKVSNWVVITDGQAHYTFSKDDLQLVAPAVDHDKIVALLREARATLEMWKDVAPAFSLCADIDRALAGVPK